MRDRHKITTQVNCLNGSALPSAGSGHYRQMSTTLNGLGNPDSHGKAKNNSEMNWR